MKGILFLCVANSARSQLAEALARRLAPPAVQVWSAGSAPSQVRPEVLKVLAEVGIDASAHYSKHVDEIPRESVDTVISLCAEESCPLYLGQATRLHWPLPDPAAHPGDEAQRLDAFRQVREQLQARLELLFATV